MTARLALFHGNRLRAVQLTSCALRTAVSWSAIRPHSLAYGHTDPPMALAAWVVEKFHGWTVAGVTADPPLALDDLIADVMLYWLTAR